MSLNKPARRIVLKLGTNLLTSGRDHLDTEIMSGLVGQIAGLRRQGLEFLIVTSGAVAAGRSKLGLTPGSSRALKGIPLKQVLAAVGQGGLMKTYEELFGKHGITVAQALLSRSDLVDRAGYLNARNTLLALIDLGIIGVINENDVVAVEELEGACFGDNDNLSAMVANLVDADLLIMLTDIGGLFTADPSCNDGARLITEVVEITADIQAAATGPKAGGGTGGMVTKLEAARLATDSGVTVVIAPGREPDIIARILRGEAIGTRFVPSARRESRERWMLSGLCTRGKLTVDEGASRALATQNRSLLAAGIKSINGDFERGDIVDIFDSSGKRLGCGISSYSSAELSRIKGERSENIVVILGHDYGAEVVHRNNLALLRED
jgi:glutamate 5-kinase